MPSVKDAAFRVFIVGLLILALAACGAGGDDGPPTGVKYYAYLPDPLDDCVYTFSIDPATGVPTPSPTVSLASNLQAQSLAVTPSGRFAYVFGSIRPSIYAYSIDPDTGDWNGVPGTPFLAGVLPSRLAVEPSGRYLYATSYEARAVAVMRINEDTGQPKVITGSPFAALGGPFEIGFEPSGRFAYVLCIDTETVLTYAIQGTTGALIPVGGPVSVGTDPQSLTVDPSGRRLYVPNRGSKDISAFAIDAATGALSAVPGSPFAVPQLPPFMLFPEALAVEPSGRAAFVACMGSMTLASFLIDGATGALTPTGTVVTTWNSPKAIAVGPTGRHIYVAHSSNPGTLSYHEIEPATGAIWLEDALTVGQFPSVLVISRLSR